jgi:ABC-2 type transport system permease protein
MSPEQINQIVVFSLIGASLLVPILLLIFVRPIRAVFLRETFQYFRSPIAYGVAFALLFFMGLWFSAQVSFAARGDQFQPVDPTSVISTTIGVLTFLLFLVGPLLAMRLIAEEAREGTIETLMTLPINESSFIIGKFLAVWGYYTVIILLSLTYALALNVMGGELDAGRIFGIYYGAWLYAGAVLAVCTIWSAITEDQIVAAFLGAATILILYVVEILVSFISNLGTQAWVLNLQEGVRELGLTSHYNSTIAEGLFRAHDLLYFLFLIIAAMFITTRLVEIRRWRA